MVLPPNQHSADTLLVNTGLKPSPTRLKEANAPLSKLHPATSVVSHLPFLSDRPPSWRHLQVDAKTIGFHPFHPFHPIHGEIEPLFCTLSIYHVETNAPSYTPSNLNIANLYVVLIIHKVLPVDPSAVEVYTSPTPSSKDAGKIFDLDKYRSKAERASDGQGQFLTPFCFGVAPLLQVFRTEVPTTMASSRAVQIPLFHLLPGRGERPILDHIMVMLYPRASHQTAEPAPLTNGGTAMLVMRDFGYLGLHSVVHNKSSLARSRLVDFSGELQLRRANENDDTAQPPTDGCRDYVVPAWHENYTSEPSVNLGRNVVVVKSLNKRQPQRTEPEKDSSESRSLLYAQEMAPITIQPNPNSGRSYRSSSSRIKGGRWPLAALA